ncbi:copper chaperone PCu(A)C [Nitratireductor sp. CH_MIT9313-5]|uniref:copper chaperone PCu(A)C n=1 Tax=Nitratireductor sp. CH_MIT9313-5 TaxID=3107764 RepID=UPI0030082E9C
MTAMEFWHAVARSGGARFKKAVPGLAAGLVFVLLQTPSETLAHSYELDDIAVGHVWASPSEEGAGGIAVYGPVLNRGGKSARLVGASSPLAEDVGFRISKDGEINWLEFIELRPNKPVSLAAWREHIWLSGIRDSIEQGDSFELILDFGDAGKLPVKVIIEEEGGH